MQESCIFQGKSLDDVRDRAAANCDRRKSSASGKQTDLVRRCNGGFDQGPSGFDDLVADGIADDVGKRMQIELAHQSGTMSVRGFDADF